MLTSACSGTDKLAFQLLAAFDEWVVEQGLQEDERSEGEQGDGPALDPVSVDHIGLE